MSLRPAVMESLIDKVERMEKMKGERRDEGKARYDLIPPGPLHYVACVYTAGSYKYSANNWRTGVKLSKLFAALMRHAWAWCRGESLDAETGLPHMASVVFHAMAIMEFEQVQEREDLDDRWDASLLDMSDYEEALEKLKEEAKARKK